MVQTRRGHCGPQRDSRCGPQRRRSLPQPEHRDGGFALLLALLGGLALLLSSLSVQTAALQSRASEQRLVLRRQHEDALFSAAQLVAGQLRQRCLLALPATQAEPAGQVPCIAAAAQEEVELQQGRKQPLPGADADAGGYRLVDYHPADPHDPQQPGGDLELEWQPAGGGTVRRRLRLELLATAPPQDPLQGEEGAP